MRSSDRELAERYAPEVAAAADLPDWPEPVPFNAPDLPEFPLDTLPAALRDYAAALAEELQVAVEMPAMLELAAVSTAVSRKARVALTPTWTEHLNIGVVIVANPGERKSPAFLRATEPLRFYERERFKELEPQIRCDQRQRERLEKRLEHLNRRWVQAGNEEHEAIESELRAAEAELDSFKPTHAPRLVLGDVSTEKLAACMAENDSRAAVISDEGAFLAVLAGRYETPRVLANIEVALQGLQNSPISVDRIGRQTIRIDDPALTVCLTVQPEVMRRFATSGEMQARGLLGRFAYIYPRSLIGTRNVEPPSVSETTRSAYERCIVTLAHDGIPTEAAQVRPIGLSPHARVLLRRFGAELEPRMGPSGDLGPIVSWVSKLEGKVARLAGLLHCVELRSLDGHDPLPAISGKTMRAAIQLGWYLVDHAWAAHGMAAGHSDDTQCQYVLRRWMDTGHSKVRERDLQQRCRGVGSAEDFRQLLEHMRDEHNMVRGPETEASGSRGGRPSPHWHLNPRAWPADAGNPQNSQNLDGAAPAERI